MTKRENLLALLRKEKFEEIPVEFNLCPDLEAEFRRRTGSSENYADYYGMPWKNVEDIRIPDNPAQFRKYYPFPLKDGTLINSWGVAHEPGSAAARHMMQMRHPLAGVEDLEILKNYPYPDYGKGDRTHQKPQVQAIHEKGFAAVGNMQVTIWETAWYMRSMENLMEDMMCDEPLAEVIFDKVTDQAVIRARAYAEAGVDIIYLGDDIGMQRAAMMSNELYRKWLKPRLTEVIRTIKAVNPDILVFYHSCGYVTPFIPDLIEAGIDVLNPIQSECMDFKEIYETYSDRISFHGTIGTQTTMPFGTPEEVKETVFRNLKTAEKGGLLVAPTHLLEPEVPWENIEAYVEACREWSRTL